MILLLDLGINTIDEKKNNNNNKEIIKYVYSKGIIK